jgi:hypothetical protein
MLEKLDQEQDANSRVPKTAAAFYRPTCDTSTVGRTTSACSARSAQADGVRSELGVQATAEDAEAPSDLPCNANGSAHGPSAQSTKYLGDLRLAWEAAGRVSDLVRAPLGRGNCKRSSAASEER